MNDRARTTVLLIRHAQIDAIAWLPGRSPDVSLNQAGRAQAERLRTRLSAVDISAIYSSPLQRAIETAGPLARERMDALGLTRGGSASIAPARWRPCQAASAPSTFRRVSFARSKRHASGIHSRPSCSSHTEI